MWEGELDKIFQVRAAQTRLFLRGTHLPLPKAGTKPQHRRASPLSGACAKMLLLAAISESGHEGSQLILRPTITEGLLVTEGRDPGLLSHMDSHDVGNEGGATEST